MSFFPFEVVRVTDPDGYQLLWEKKERRIEVEKGILVEVESIV